MIRNPKIKYKNNKLHQTAHAKLGSSLHHPQQPIIPSTSWDFLPFLHKVVKVSIVNLIVVGHIVPSLSAHNRYGALALLLGRACDRLGRLLLLVGQDREGRGYLLYLLHRKAHAEVAGEILDKEGVVGCFLLWWRVVDFRALVHIVVERGIIIVTGLRYVGACVNKSFLRGALYLMLANLFHKLLLVLFKLILGLGLHGVKETRLHGGCIRDTGKQVACILQIRLPDAELFALPALFGSFRDFLYLLALGSLKSGELLLLLLCLACSNCLLEALLFLWRSGRRGGTSFCGCGGGGRLGVCGCFVLRSVPVVLHVRIVLGVLIVPVSGAACHNHGGNDHLRHVEIVVVVPLVVTVSVCAKCIRLGRWLVP
ncbi:hypothetical protein BC830DRAFT_1091911 [Chytriomyces sp. MP71]|nr:hypothetical protein BC830DRAFT_1091911 [Chytriomyces sp. MP71]